MRQIYYANKISEKGTKQWKADYQLTDCLEEAEAIMVRSASLHETEFPDSLLAIARAGAGVNNIPLNKCAEKGIVVFNTPGANANSVVELALCGMLLGSRDVVGGINWVQTIKDDPDVAKKVEKGKSQFAGHELVNKKLGVIGLGAVGGHFANIARKLHMEVLGHDPYISIEAAWHLNHHIVRVKTREDIYRDCDFISLHTPLLDSTRHMINGETISMMKDGVVILNFARDQLVDDDAMEAALKSGKVKCYITDFPNERTASMEGVIAIPHLGASTEEAEDNCAVMAVKEIMDYLENGNILNSVTLPNCDMGVCNKAARITILHKNAPNLLSQFTTAVAKDGINISDLMNRSKGEYAYTMLDLDNAVSDKLVEELCMIEGVIRVRVIK